jgi:hypothetical protein
MRRLLALPALLVLAFPSAGPAHVSPPPGLPEMEELAPANLSVSATNCDVVGKTCCAYGTNHLLRCKKNGQAVSLSFNSVNQQYPDVCEHWTTWNVNLTPLNLQVGDVLEWEFKACATGGPYRNQWQSVFEQTTVVP